MRDGDKSNGDSGCDPQEALKPLTMYKVKIQLRDKWVAVYVNDAEVCTAAREDRAVYKKAIVYAADPYVHIGGCWMVLRGKRVVNLLMVDSHLRVLRWCNVMLSNRDVSWFSCRSNCDMHCNTFRSHQSLVTFQVVPASQRFDQSLLL